MMRVVKTDGGRFAVEWRSDIRPYGWIRVVAWGEPNLTFETEAEAKKFAREMEARI